MLPIRMFNEIGYCTRVKHSMLKISYGEVIIAKVYKLCALHILKGANVVLYSLSSSSEDFHEENKL